MTGESEAAKLMVELMDAAAKGDVEAVDCILQKGVDINCKNAMGYVALRESVVNNHPDVCRLLLDRGAHVDEQDNMGWTALHWAATKGHATMVLLLLERKANVNGKTKDGDTPAHKAGGKGHLTVLRLLVDHDADLSIRNRFNIDVLEQTEHRMLALEAREDAAEEYRKRQECVEFIRSSSGLPSCEGTAITGSQSQRGIIDVLAENKQLRQCCEDIRVNMATVEAENSRLEKVIRTQNADRLVLEEHIEELVRVRDVKQAELDELASAHHDTVETLREDIERRQQQVVSIQNNLERVSRIQQQSELQLSNLQEEVKRLRSDKGCLESQLSNMREEHLKVMEQLADEQSIHQASDTRLKAELREVTRMAEQQQMLLAARLADAESAKVAKNRKDEKLKMATEEHEVELVSLLAAIEAMQSRLAEKENKIQGIHLLEAQKASLAERYKNENEQLHNEVEALRQELECVRNAHDGVIEEIKTESHERQVQMEKNLQQAQEEASQLADRVGVMTRDRASIDAAIHECERLVQECTGVLSIPETELLVTGKVLGKGSFAEVRSGHWRSTPVAVKTFHEVIVTDHNRPLFIQEMSVCSRVRHPHVVAICGVTAIQDAAPRIILELLEGSLADVVGTAQSCGQYLTFREQLDITVDCLLGISHLHDLKPDALLHGDIRPTNILLTGMMTAKIGDLGAAHFLGVSLSVGPVSLDYLAPERLPSRNGSHPHNTPGADIYSLGVTLAEVFTGELADCTSRHRHFRKIEHDKLRDLCLRMTDDDPEQRPSARYVLAGLQALQSHESYESCSPKRLVKGKRFGERVELTNEPW